MEEEKVNNDDEQELVGRPLKTEEQEGEPRGQSRAVCSADSLKWKGLTLLYTTPQVSLAALHDACLVARKTITVLSHAINNCLQVSMCVFVHHVSICGVCVCVCVLQGVNFQRWDESLASQRDSY